MIAPAAAATHTGPTFLPHKKHLTLTEKVAYFKRSVHHDQQVVDWLQSRHAPRTLQRVSTLGWYRAALTWQQHLLSRYSAKLQARIQTSATTSIAALRAYAGPCLASIIDLEDPAWDPRQWNTSGSGAYGLPQALPAGKMASAGPDWATNPYTQIRWLRDYVSKYGGACEALAYRQTHTSY